MSGLQIYPYFKKMSVVQLLYNFIFQLSNINNKTLFTNEDLQYVFLRLTSYSSQPTHNCPIMSRSSEKGYSIPMSFIILYVNISHCPKKNTEGMCSIVTHNNVSCYCCYYINR